MGVLDGTVTVRVVEPVPPEDRVTDDGFPLAVIPLEAVTVTPTPRLNPLTLARLIVESPIAPC